LTNRTLQAILVTNDRGGEQYLNPINQRVKKLRLERKLSQEEFGKVIGLSKSGVSNIENGTRAVRKNHIRIICSEFGVSEAWLCEGLAQESTNLEAFITFLKSASYLVNVQPISEQETEITLKKDGVETLYSESEFKELQTGIEKAIEYQVWLKQSQREQK